MIYLLRSVGEEVAQCRPEFVKYDDGDQDCMLPIGMDYTRTRSSQNDLLDIFNIGCQYSTNEG